jgi:TRAP-type C4-dicarboxylate transport system substrate-binding protein
VLRLLRAVALLAPRADRYRPAERAEDTTVAESCHTRCVRGKRARAAVAGACAVVLLGAACGGKSADKSGGEQPARTVDLTLANLDSDPTNFDSPDFVAAVERLSGGSIRIDTKYGWRSNDLLEHVEKGTIADVRRGKVDLAIVAARAWDLVGVKSFHALLAPFLVDSLELERRVIQSPLAARMLAGVRALGLVPVALVPGPLRYPLGVTRALVRPRDYAGAAIGIRPSEIERQTFEALGASVQPYSAGSLSGLDGADLDVSTIATNRYEEQARELTTNVAFWPRALIVVMNRKRFEALTTAEQAVLRHAGRAAAEPHLAVLRADARRWLDTVCPGRRLRLIAASAADRVALRRAVEPVFRELERHQLTRELIARIRARRRDAPRTDTVHCATPRAVAEGRSGPFDGRWKLSLTRGQLIQQGAPGGIADRLQGSWDVEFAHGRFEYRNRNTGANARGSFVVQGSRARFVFASAVGLTAGTVAEVRWSAYRDRLRFIAVSGHSSELLGVGVLDRERS